MDETIESLLEDFLLESRERLERLEEILLAISSAGEAAPPEIDEIRLQLHTLKGNSGMMGLRDLQAVAHDMEDLAPGLAESSSGLDAMLAGVDRFRDLLRGVVSSQIRADLSGAPDEASEDSAPASEEPEFDLDLGRVARDVHGALRVSFSDLDDLVDRLGEMVIYRNRHEEALTRWRGQGGLQVAASVEWDGIQRSYEQLAGSLDALRDGVMRLRMVPLSTLFRPLARIVHDEGRRSGKRVRFVTEGGDTPLDRALLELSSEVLGHLVRNAVVHGIEGPEQRRRAGKGEGLVRLSAAADSREVRIEVLDDGGGVRREAVLEEAERHGFDLDAATDPLQLLFRHGFSTRLDADLSAGRGVGLASVREAVTRKGGKVEVFSEEGVGTLFRLRLPLSVSITRALLVGCDGEDYVLPLSSIAESVELKAANVHEINGAQVLSWRGGLIPLLDLGYSFGTSDRRRREGVAMVLEVEGDHRAVSVDRVHGLREVVVRGLDELAGEPRGVAGTTILGDGRAVLILDPGGLMAMSPFGLSGQQREKWS